MAEEHRSFKVDSKKLKISVSGDADVVTQVYNSLQGVLSSLVPTSLSEGGGYTFTAEESKKKSD